MISSYRWRKCMKKEELKTLLIRLTPELHKQMRHISIDTGISLNEYVIEAFKKIVEEYNKEKSNGIK